MYIVMLYINKQSLVIYLIAVPLGTFRPVLAGTIMHVLADTLKHVLAGILMALLADIFPPVAKAVLTISKYAHRIICFIYAFKLVSLLTLNISKQ